MNAIVLKCRPGSRFHFGRYAPDADTALNDTDSIMMSDTLLAAFLNMYRDLFGDAQPLVNAVASGDLNISSMYHCFYQNKQYTWLLPKPACFGLHHLGSNNKRFKEIQYLSKGVWETLLHPGSLFEHPEIKLLHRNKVAVLASEIQASFSGSTGGYTHIGCNHVIPLPKVLVRDNPDDKTVYQLSVTEIADNREWAPGLEVHYYFLLNQLPQANNTVVERFYQVINMIPYYGIGAERSTIGHIEGIETIENWQLRPSEPHDTYAVTASLYSPNELEMDGMLYYRTLLRGGRRLGTNTGRASYLKTVRMIGDGAIIQKESAGCLADVSTAGDKTYLRHGRAFCLPLPKNWLTEI